MKKQFLTVIFLSAIVVSCTEAIDPINPNFIGKSLEAIENNEHWEVLKKASGDLNKDGHIDYSIILESKDSILEKRCTECFNRKNKPRIIVVLLSKNGKEKVSIQNNDFIARGDEGGMSPYIEPKLTIKNGLLEIYYQYTRSNVSYVFEYKDNSLVIVSATDNGVHAASGNFEFDKYDFKKGILISETGNISEKDSNTKSISFDIKPKSLAEFKEMFEWEIVENKFL